MSNIIFFQKKKLSISLIINNICRGGVRKVKCLITYIYLLFIPNFCFSLLNRCKINCVLKGIFFVSKIIFYYPNKRFVKIFHSITFHIDKFINYFNYLVCNRKDNNVVDEMKLLLCKI